MNFGSSTVLKPSSVVSSSLADVGETASLSACGCKLSYKDLAALCVLTLHGVYFLHSIK